MKIKKLIKKTPVIGPLLLSIRGKKETTKDRKIDFIRESTDIADDMDRAFAQIKNVLQYSKLSDTPYNAAEYPAGYHTLEFFGRTLKGQRLPGARLEASALDFNGKSVLDIGCNQGGMLFNIRDKIRYGIGLDFNHSMINAANVMKRRTDASNLDFFTFDLENEPLELIRDFLPQQKVDIVFLLAVCRWIHNWQEVILFAESISTKMLFESNGSDIKQAAQEAFLRKLYASVELLKTSSDDDSHKKPRKLFLCGQNTT